MPNSGSPWGSGSQSRLRGLGSRLDQIIAWLDANCGADGWTSTPSSTRGVVNDALAVYFLDPTIATAFVARWCAIQRFEILDGVYRVRDDDPAASFGSGQVGFDGRTTAGRHRAEPWWVSAARIRVPPGGRTLMPGCCTGLWAGRRLSVIRGGKTGTSR